MLYSPSSFNVELGLTWQEFRGGIHCILIFPDDVNLADYTTEVTT